MIKSLIDCFPHGFKPNDQQVKLLTEIDQAFNQGEKFVICSAPTGTGKSFLAKTVANSASPADAEYVELVNSYVAYKQSGMGYEYEEECLNTRPFGAFALTITKALQDQYVNLFTDTKMLKGKANYTCAVDDQFSVDVGPCVHVKKIKEDCWIKNKCPYYVSRNQALTSTFSTLNYKMFFALPGHLKRRQYLICDEASELEEELVREFSCVVSLDFLKSCKITPKPAYIDDHSKMQKWLGEVAVDVLERAQQIEKTFQNVETLTNFLENERQKTMSLKNLHNKIALLLDSWLESEYIIEKDKNNITFTPLKVNKLAERLFKYADKVILMSATIINHQNLAKTLGITNYRYIESNSSFDSKKSPIFVAAKNKLNARNLQEKLPKLIKVIEQICDRHKTDKGIIHTHTNEITKFLQNNFKSSRCLFREPGTSNEDILEQHIKTDKPTVLVSPSMTFGVDLKDDLARFQIIIKAPYLPLLNNRIKKLFEMDSKWYETRMLSVFIQACGRGTRSKHDSCVTYVLDGNIAEAVLRNKDVIPKYFLDRFV